MQHSRSELTAAYMAVLEGKAVLYAVWPGQWRSDLFVIDDLNAFADAVGISREDAHVHDVEWKLSADDGVSRYAWIDCKLNCNWGNGDQEVCKRYASAKGVGRCCVEGGWKSWR